MIAIVGLPYSLVIVEGMPKAFTMVLEASELNTESVEPTAYRISDGGGVRNVRKATGKASCLRV